MQSYPVHYAVVRPTNVRRLQLVARVIAFVALGVLGLSFGTIFFFAYLILPVVAASRTMTHSSESQVADDRGRVEGAIQWFAAVCAWAALLADRLPTQSPDEVVRIVIDKRGKPPTSSAIWRVITGVPSALVLAVLGFFGTFVWLWAAISVLLAERVGERAFNYLEGLQRWSIRLLAYQASLVDEYPPFSFSDVPLIGARDAAEDYDVG